MHQFKKNLLWLIINSFILLASISANAQSINQNSFKADFVSYYPQWYLGGYVFKNGPRAAGETTLLSPLFENSDQLLFSSLRLLDKSGKPWESSVALGYRCLNIDHTNLMGLYGGIDHLKTTTGDSFNQINVGVEAWHQDWFLGANLYHPYGSHQHSAPNPQTFSISQNGGYRNIGFTQTTENALPGADAEVGRTLFGGLTVYAGSYYFHETDTRTLAGPKARAEYIFYAEPNHKIFGVFDRVAVEGLVTNDAVRGINYYGGLTVGISWGNTNANSNLRGVERHMVDRIRRDVDVVTESNMQDVHLPVNIRDVDNLNDFNQALADDKADVIAVHGQIKDVADATIDRGVYLTGNTYQFVQDNKPITVNLTEGGELIGASNDNPGDHGLLHIKGSEDSNITIRDLGLSVDQTAPLAIFHSSNDGSMGTLNVEQIHTNGSLSIEVSGENNTATIDHITNSIFNLEQSGTLLPGGPDDVVDTINPLSALNFVSSNSGKLFIGEITNNMIETQGAYSPAMLFRTANGNMDIDSINMNSISTHDGRSPGLGFIATGGTMNIKDIIGNEINTSSTGIGFIAESSGTLNIHQVSDNQIKLTNTDQANDSTPILSGILVLSEKDSNLNFDSINHNNISIDCTNENIFFGIDIDADSGNIVGKEINANQVVLNNNSDYARGFNFRQWNETWDENQLNFIQLDSLASNKVILTNYSDDPFSDGFSLFAMSPDAVTIKSFVENFVTRADFDGELK